MLFHKSHSVIRCIRIGQSFGHRTGRVVTVKIICLRLELLVGLSELSERLTLMLASVKKETSCAQFQPSIVPCTHHLPSPATDTPHDLVRPSGIENSTIGEPADTKGSSTIKYPFLSSCKTSPFKRVRMFASPVGDSPHLAVKVDEVSEVVILFDLLFSDQVIKVNQCQRHEFINLWQPCKHKLC